MDVDFNIKKEKFVRFYNDGKENIEKPLYKRISAVPLLKSEGINGKKLGSSSSSRIRKVFPARGDNPNLHNQQPKLSSTSSWRWSNIRIIDPGSEIYLEWNRIFLFSSLVALFVDPLFFYLPALVHDSDTSSFCMTNDLNLETIVTCFRTVADLFYVLRVVIKFRTAYIAPSSRVFGRGELVTDPNMIARQYMRSDLFIDVIATLPLPQIVIWFLIPAIKSSTADQTNNTLVLSVLLQYIPRFYLIFPLSSQIIKTTGVVTKTAWAGAAFNLVLYMLASHILGASWYLFSIERHASCWKSVCRHEFSPIRCSVQYLDRGGLHNVDRKTWANSTSVFANCNPNNNIAFNYGIFKNAVTDNVVSSEFLEKYFYCLWWGLQNLSPYGTALTTSTFVGETTFAILISVIGLVLFAHLIGNMQAYLQSITVKLEEWRVRRRDTEQWMRHRQLPQDLQERV